MSEYTIDPYSDAEFQGVAIPFMSADAIRGMEESIIYPAANALVAIIPNPIAKAGAATAVNLIHRMMNTPGVLEEVLKIMSLRGALPPNVTGG
jgi:hypothetical protein